MEILLGILAACSILTNVIVIVAIWHVIGAQRDVTEASTIASAATHTLRASLHARPLSPFGHVK